MSKRPRYKEVTPQGWVRYATRVVAAKVHTCSRCFEEILPGEGYLLFPLRSCYWSKPHGVDKICSICQASSPRIRAVRVTLRKAP